MARVSLIVPRVLRLTESREDLVPFRQILEGQGHTVETLVSDDTSSLSVAAVSGLRAATGDLFVVLDPSRGYLPDGLPALLAPLIEEKADLVVGSRDGKNVASLPHLLTRLLARPLLGVSEPTSGVVALTRRAFRAADDEFRPIGDRFTLELVARVEGPRREVPIRIDSATPLKGPRISLTDLRHFKRLADDRFGNLSRLVQFCMVGASGMVVDLSCYALFQFVFSRLGLFRSVAPLIGGPLDLAVAGALAIAVALVWNFSLNRRLTFSYARQGSIGRQFLTYALSNALGIALSFSVRVLLPTHVGFFSRHRLAAAVVGIVAATGISFSLSRWVVFRRRAEPAESARLRMAEPSPAP